MGTPCDTIQELALQIRAARRTCVETVQHCLRRIDESETRIRAWVIVDREGALGQAHRLDAELARGNWRGPLHGIPLGIKDIMDVRGFPTAAGSHLWAQETATQDATLVKRLRRRERGHPGQDGHDAARLLRSAGDAQPVER